VKLVLVKTGNGNPEAVPEKAGNGRRNPDPRMTYGADSVPMEIRAERQT